LSIVHCPFSHQAVKSEFEKRPAFLNSPISCCKYYIILSNKRGAVQVLN